MKKSAQIISVTFALSLGTAYVAWSQLRQARSVAPSSKMMVITEPQSKSNLVAVTKPGPAAALRSNSPPVLKSPPAPAKVASTNSIHPSHSDIFISGSKSARVFNFESSTAKIVLGPGAAAALAEAGITNPATWRWETNLSLHVDPRP